MSEEGRTCAECGGTIVTRDCTITETDGSQLRECADCGAHGVRYFEFDGIDTVAGPVYGGNDAETILAQMYVNAKIADDGHPNDARPDSFLQALRFAFPGEAGSIDDYVEETLSGVDDE